MSDLDYSDDDESPDVAGGDTLSPAEDGNRRAHHNALERKRRDHIKDSFTTLKQVIPIIDGERSSRALILKKAVEYITSMRSKINDHQLDIDDLKRQNEQLEDQIKAFEQTISDDEFMSINDKIRSTTAPSLQREHEGAQILNSTPPPRLVTKAALKSIINSTAHDDAGNRKKPTSEKSTHPRIASTHNPVSRLVVPVALPPAAISSPSITTTASVIRDDSNDQLNMMLINQQHSSSTGRLPYTSLTLPLVPATTADSSLPVSVIADSTQSQLPTTRSRALSSTSGRPTIAGEMITPPRSILM